MTLQILLHVACSAALIVGGGALGYLYGARVKAKALAVETMAVSEVKRVL